MKSSRLATLAAVMTLLAATRAHGDPEKQEIIHIKSRFEVRTERGSVVTLDPGYYVPEPAWDDLDLEMRRLQDAETRLKAENESLRKDTKSPTPLIFGALSLVTGLVLGAWIIH